MADWSRIQHQVDALISSIATARSDQYLWTWREALRKAVQDFRETGTPRVSPLRTFDGSNDVDEETGAVRLFGMLVDNSQSGTDAHVSTYNTNTVTEGTTNPLAIYWAPANRVVAYAHRPIVFSTAFSWSATSGTQTALEDGTLSAADVLQVAWVYTE